MALSELNLNPVILVVILGCILISLVWFIKDYDLPAQRIVRKLSQITCALESYKPGITDAQLDEIEGLFDRVPLRHEWAEYRDSLHAFRDTDGSVVAIRATASSEAFFTKQSIIDSRIQADFYRHLPGILTGIGIIGTFAGLVIGLAQFKPGEPLLTLAPLLHEVTSAFIASGSAIAAAMIVTWREKSIVNTCYRGLEEMNSALDRLFDEGVGEDYLYRLVSSSEKNSANTAALKDALIEDLSKLMHEVAEKQIDAAKVSNQHIADTIGKAITDSLEKPMGELMKVVERASGSQGEAVSGLLENLLTAFMAKLDETFGQQIQSINIAIQRSSDSMLKVQEALGQLVNDISGAGQRAADEMSKKLEEAMTNAATAQSQMNQNLRDFIEELRGLVTRQQSETKNALDEMLTKLLQDMRSHYEAANQERVNAAKDTRDKIREIADGSKEIYSELTSSIGKLVSDVSEATVKTEENIRAIQGVTTTAISGMNDGALLIGQSAEKFRSAGDSVSEVFERNEALTQRIASMADAMELSASTLRSVVNDHSQVRDQVLNLVGQLQGLVTSAQSESGIRKELIDDLRVAADAIREVERESADYLEQVNKALEESFRIFGQEMVSQVTTLKNESDQVLTGGLSALSGTVESMMAQVERMNRQRAE
jgi:ribosome-binding protein aMBF1 (putative translation factor)/sugar-specific transcriptional regulator TrmB